MPTISVPLTFRAMTADDVDYLARTWGWSPPHRANVEKGLAGERAGEVDYLVACGPSGLPVASGGVTYTEQPDAGVIWQLSVDERWQSCGIGTLLIGEAERLVRERGVRWAELGVEDENPGAARLYERLGYHAIGREPASWDVQAEDGSVVRYDTMITRLRKEV